MSERIDISNQEFGNWHVNRYLDNSEYDCTCLLCNRHFRVSGYKLRNSISTSCPQCLARLKGEKNRIKLEGTVINNWNILEYLGNSIYLCKNTEGKLMGFTSHQLKFNKNINNIKETNPLFSVNSVIGRLKIIEYIGNTVYRCICECGNEHFITEYDLNNGINTLCRKCNPSYKQTSWKEDIIARLSNLDFKYDNSILTFKNGLTVILCDKFEYLDKKAKQNKRIQYLKNNKRLIFIMEHEWKNVNKQIKLIDLITRAAKSNQFTKIYARKLKVIIPDTWEVRKIEDEYHLQGYSPSSINLGFRYKGELIALMTFGLSRFSRDCQYEMIRLVYKNDIIVLGGAEKLFKHFVDTYKPESIVSFCDIAKFDGEVYKKLGFNSNNIEITSPNYSWVNSDCSLALPRYKTMKHKLIANGLGSVDDTEDSIMIRQGYTKVFDCGNIKYTWIR